MVLKALFWFAGEVGPAAWILWFLYLVVCKWSVTECQEVSMIANVRSSLMVSVFETLWAVGTSVLAA
jgi:hypothetical protein